MQWESPTSDGGVGIDNYTLTGAGISITTPLTVLSNEPLMATLTLAYNEMHMVSITASNCAGESTASGVTIHEGILDIIFTVLCIYIYLVWRNIMAFYTTVSIYFMSTFCLLYSYQPFQLFISDYYWFYGLHPDRILWVMKGIVD